VKSQAVGMSKHHMGGSSRLRRQ